MTSPRLLPLVLAATFAACSARAATVNFGSAADLTQFSLNGNAATNHTFSATAGVGGGGGIVSTSSDFFTDYAFYSTGLDNAVGTSQSVSLDYRMAFQGSGPDLRVGFTTSVTGALDGGTGDVWAETYGPASPKFFSLSGDGQFVNGPSVVMTAGDWFRIEVILSHTAATTYSAVANVFSLGAAGTDTPVLISTTNIASFTSTAFGGSSEIFAGFHLFGQTTAADNFNIAGIVPEPSAFALAGLGALFALRRRRK